MGGTSFYGHATQRGNPSDIEDSGTSSVIRLEPTLESGPHRVSDCGIGLESENRYRG